MKKVEKRSIMKKVVLGIIGLVVMAMVTMMIRWYNYPTDNGYYTHTEYLGLLTKIECNNPNIHNMYDYIVQETINNQGFRADRHISFVDETVGGFGACRLIDVNGKPTNIVFRLGYNNFWDAIFKKQYDVEFTYGLQY